jgi:hypothetical protein
LFSAARASYAVRAIQLCTVLLVVTGINGLVACGSFGAADDGGGAPSTDGGATQSEGGTAQNGDAGGTPGVPTTDGYGAAVLADKPIAYFRLEETSGVSAKNEVVGSSVTAILPQTGVTLAAEGISSGRHAVRLDDANAHVDVIGAPSFVDNRSFSIEAWVESSGNGTTNTFIFSNIDKSGTERTGQWLFVEASGTVRSEQWSNGALLLYGVSPSALAAVPTWAHIVFMHSDVDQTDVLYVNAAKGTGGRISAGARPASMAAHSWGGFQGRLDEIAIYDKMLSPARIAAHYAAR